MHSDLVTDRDFNGLDNSTSALERTVSVSEVLLVITTSAVAALPEVDVAGVCMLTSDGAIETMAATDPVVVQADTVQRELEQGSLYVPDDGGGRLVVPDLATERRWPAYGPRIAELGRRSLIAAQLRLTGRRRASLTLFAREPWGVVEADSGGRDLIEMLASHAAFALEQGESVEQLSEALRSRKVIGQALGLVMGHYDMNEEQAFAYVSRMSQDRNVKLRDICAQLITDFSDTRSLGRDQTDDAPAE